jgi:hypothetical protein
MKKRAIIFIFLLIATIFSYGQEKDFGNIYRLPHNSIYFEAGGVSVLYSLNYERVFNINRFFISPRIGASFFKMNEYSVFYVPVLLNFGVRCYKGLYFELGTGVNMLATIDLWMVSNIGIRVQCKGGFLFRAGFTPLIMPDEVNYKNYHLFPMAGISFGGSFGRKYK